MFKSTPASQICKNGNRQRRNVLAPRENGTSESERIEDKIDRIKRNFHRDRKILLKHLPRNVTKREISQALAGFTIKNIDLTSNGETSPSALLTIENAHNALDRWDHAEIFKLRGYSISAAPTLTDSLLCVARLPVNFYEGDFIDLIKSYGAVAYSFLMVSSLTGKNKGYGFVRYAKKEQALLARNALHGKTVEGVTLACDWLDPQITTYEKLNSTCLYVDNLPPNYKDMAEFRKVFSKAAEPPYCQVALKNGLPQQWGLVEYLDWEKAESAWENIDGYSLRGCKIRVSFHIPGVRAINLYLRLLNEDCGERTGKSEGLLNDPSSESVAESISTLSKQNPLFAANLKNIIFSQLQDAKVLGLPTNQDDKSRQIGEKHAFNAFQNEYNPQNSNLVAPSQPGCYQKYIPPPITWNGLVTYAQPGFGPALNRPANNSALFSNSSIPFQTTPVYLERTVDSNQNDIGKTGVCFVPSQSPFALADDNSSLSELSSITAQSVPSDTKVQPSGGISMVLNCLAAPFEPYSSSRETSSSLLVPAVPSGISHPSTVPSGLSHTATVPSRVSPPCTPTSNSGQKRKLLPSPEASPEGDYIGQHSQGLGGHYADSYFKKKKRTALFRSVYDKKYQLRRCALLLAK